MSHSYQLIILTGNKQVVNDNAFLFITGVDKKGSLIVNSPISDHVGYDGRIQSQFPYMATPHTISADEPSALARGQAKGQALMQSLG